MSKRNQEQQLRESRQHVQQEIPQLLIPEHMDRLWSKMTRIYGHKWASIAENDDGTWLAGLRGITPDQIAAALGKLVMMAKEWPPTLPEFRKLCLAVDDEDLERFISRYAFRGIQSFDLNQMTRKDEQRIIDRHREAATNAYFDQQINKNLIANNLLE